MNVQIKRKIKIIEEKKFKDFHIGLFLVIMLFTILLSGSTMREKEVYARELSTEEVEVLVSENIIEDSNEPTNIVTSENITDVEEITIEESHPNEELDGMDVINTMARIFDTYETRHIVIYENQPYILFSKLNNNKIYAASLIYNIDLKKNQWHIINIDDYENNYEFKIEL